MDVPSQADLVGSIDAFLTRHPAIGEARFGRDATGEPGLVASLRAGRSPTMRIAAKIAEYIKAKDAEAGHGLSDSPAACGASAGNGGADSRREATHA